MAAAAEVPLVNILINDIELQVPKGELVVEAVKRLGLEVPIFCYHPRMKPVGMCRMCLVETGMKQPDGTIRKMPKPQTACTLPCSEGLAIYTDSEMVHNDRRGVLEFLLINHPLDCPVCDRGGECPLQNNTLFYGPSTSRFIEMKRHAPKAYPLSKYVKLDLERCIQCGRCVRFTEEISGDSQLAFRFRGNNMQPSTFQMEEFDSKFSGNTIEICPVGALTSATYRFRARPWDLQTQPGICTKCSNGCNVYVDYRANEIVRINGRTNEAVNEEWTCDRGKFGHYVYNSDKRLGVPLQRTGNELKETSWASVYGEIIGAFKGEVAALASGTLTNEDYFVLGKLFRSQFASDNIDHRTTRFFAKPDAGPKRSIESYESARTILIFGSSLADEEPILFLRVRKAWSLNGARIVVAASKPTDADAFAHVVLRYRAGQEGTLAAALASGTFDPATGVDSAAFDEAVRIFGEERPVVITTRAIFNSASGSAAVESLRGWAETSCYGLEANDEGAARLGAFPMTDGKNSLEILQACANGGVDALWLVGFDPFEHFDRELVVNALESVRFLVVQAHSETEALHYASVVLPMTAPTETDGTYTNLEGRVQRMQQVLPARGEAKPVWRALTELSLRMAPRTPMFNPREIMGQISSEVTEFKDVDYDDLGSTGQLVGA
jgi:NADH-quinone oxidoreductase subunit G